MKIKQAAWGLVLLGIAAMVAPADAAWVRPRKKPVTAWEGFRNSANGAVTAVMPWNWFGSGEKRKRR